MVTRKVHIKNVNVSKPKFEFDLKQICGKNNAINVIKDTHIISVEDDAIVMKLIDLKELYNGQGQTITLTIINL